MEIQQIQLHTVLNSRADKTIAASINQSTACAPSGASAGSHEAHSFVPNNLNKIEEQVKNKIQGNDPSQREFDTILHDIDGSTLFENIGSTGIALSLAFKTATGYDQENIFPYPLGNVVGGGEHGGNTAIQEFLVIPVNADSFPEAVDTNARIYHEMKERYGQKIMGMNDEGALVTRMDDEETLKALHAVASDHGARLGLDIAANELWDGSTYTYPSMNMELPPREQLKFVQKLIDRFDLYYVEDPFHEDDFDRHQKLRRETDCLVVGDDLFVTSPDRLERGSEQGSCNALIIKPNQNGTVSGTKKTVETAKENGYVPIISHRSGETCDASIAYLALEWQLPIIKAGITDIRIAKLNALLLEWQRMESEGISPEMADLPSL